MNLFKKMFSKRIPCPRCHGKKHVTMEDIIAMNKELYFLPGACAYCLEKGTVPAYYLDIVPVDEVYLSTDLPLNERKRLFKGSIRAKQRAIEYKEGYGNEFKEIVQLYAAEELTIQEIVDHLLIDHECDKEHKANITEYVNLVIKHFDKKK